MTTQAEIPAELREKAWELVKGHTCIDWDSMCSFERGCGCAIAIAAALLAERKAQVERDAEISLATGSAIIAAAIRTQIK